jgi:DNA-binding LacI/PurR family transcriptional regulator
MDMLNYIYEISKAVAGLDTSNKTIKYLAIKEQILQMILEGKYKTGDRLPSEQELASAHNVSVITSKKTLDELEKDGYIYRIKGSGSFVADSQQTEKTSHVKMIAMVLPLGSNTGGGMELFYSVEMIAKSQGYYVSVENTHRNCQLEREIILSLLKDSIKGIIYYPSFSSENFDLIKKLSIEKYPIVVIDKTIPDINIDTVLCDNYTGSYAVTKYLIGCGHRCIAFVCESDIDKTSSIRERFLGYCDALADAGIPLDINMILHPETSYQQSTEKGSRAHLCKEVAEKIQENKAVTAIQAASDADAVELIRQFAKKGIAVPDDVSIAGFDDLDVASYITP